MPTKPGYVYLLRHVGQHLDDYPNADRLETTDDRKLLGAVRPDLLLKQAGISDRPQVRMRILDLRRARRGLGRPSERWSGTVQGTLKEADDLFYDAAASLADEPMANATSGDTPFHRTYQYLWGQDVTLLPAAERLRLWDAHMEWLLGRIAILTRP